MKHRKIKVLLGALLTLAGSPLLLGLNSQGILPNDKLKVYELTESKVRYEVQETADLITLASVEILNEGENQLEILNLAALQRSGTWMVDITFDLIDPLGMPVTVEVEASRDGGSNYEVVHQAHLSGDIGNGVSPGQGRHIVWHANQSWVAALYPEVRVRVKASSESSGMGGINLFAINDDPNDPLGIVIEKEQEMLSLSGDKNESGELVRLRQAVYASLEGGVVIIDFDENGFPVQYVHQG